jgi:hypothetical protein
MNVIHVILTLEQTQVEALSRLYPEIGRAG